jgi:hypothetical protein
VSAIKYCVDCKWSRAGSTNVEHHRCSNADTVRLSRAEDDGVIYLAPSIPIDVNCMPFAKHMRRSEAGYLGFGSCGPDGKYFEQRTAPRPSRWERLTRRFTSEVQS